MEADKSVTQIYSDAAQNLKDVAIKQRRKLNLKIFDNKQKIGILTEIINKCNNEISGANALTELDGKKKFSIENVSQKLLSCE